MPQTSVISLTDERDEMIKALYINSSEGKIHQIVKYEKF